MSRAQRLGDGNPCVEARRLEPHRHVGEQRVLAAEEMGDAGHVEPEPVRMPSTLRMGL